MSVYAGPATNGARETFTLPNALTEYGFLVVTLDSRSAAGRGKRFLDAIYLKLSTGEIDDQAAGIRALWDRPYVAKGRAGIFGTSYGGTASAMALLRNPDVFKAASASSAVTDWRNYDSIYTERYMWIPQENQEGYDAGSAMNVRREAGRGPDALLRDGGQQRSPVQHPSADRRTAAGGKALPGAGGAGHGPRRTQSGPDDGVLHRKPGPGLEINIRFPEKRKALGG